MHHHLSVSDCPTSNSENLWELDRFTTRKNIRSMRFARKMAIWIKTYWIHVEKVKGTIGKPWEENIEKRLFEWNFRGFFFFGDPGNHRRVITAWKPQLSGISRILPYIYIYMLHWCVYHICIYLSKLWWRKGMSRLKLRVSVSVPWMFGDWAMDAILVSPRVRICTHVRHTHVYIYIYICIITCIYIYM